MGAGGCRIDSEARTLLFWLPAVLVPQSSLRELFLPFLFLGKRQEKTGKNDGFVALSYSNNGYYWMVSRYHRL